MPITSRTIEDLALLGLDGADRFIVESTETFSTIDAAGGPSGGSRDTLELIGTPGVDDRFEVVHGGFGAGFVTEVITTDQVTYSAIELLRFTGNGLEDTLRVADTNGDDQLHLARGENGDRISGSAQIPIDADGRFGNLTVAIHRASGNDTLTVDVTRLQSAAIYTVVADPAEVDQLVLLGTDTRDVVSSTDTRVTLAEGGNANTVQFTKGELHLITIRTLGGNDKVVLSNLAEPKRIEAGEGNDYVNLSASIDGVVFGGDGDDVLIGSAEADFLDGGRGNDALFGRGANDQLLGGEGDDFLVGGLGADVNFGGSGSDTFVWNPGDGSDVVEGDSGVDAMQVAGGSVADTFTLSADGSRLKIERQPGDVTLDLASIEQVDVNSSISFAQELSGSAAVPAVVTTASGSVLAIYHGATNTLDLRVFVDGIAQNDLTGADLRLGSNDASVLDLGEGAGWTFENGGLRRDIRGMSFPAARIAELLSGGTYVVVRSTTNPSGELRGDLQSIGNTADLTGPDVFVVQDLASTGLEGLTLGLGPADLGEVDRVTVHGRTTADTITIAATANVDIIGLAYDLTISQANPGEDQLTLAANAGNDTVLVTEDVSSAFAAADVTVSGGPGDDLLTGYGKLLGDAGDDILIGGDSGQTIRGGPRC